ncbi:hypothetical protein Herbaro_11020 [Herbaspirillum sp. WKF16]|jgi:protease I|uniref:hypothetical protein n=1 Tax=Herbaspirillum sp. WKF16 TaxID=3028312 RepID=UPI0023A9C5B2|nr:hypothetical protein [Herbaspirillum sp. WKF16]WDZ98290.1 hypothetical protein Herbaro_11020 [Herbaspirillum sp. WKF16]
MSATKHPKQERAKDYDTPSEVALDDANEMSFPNSDPVATSNITRIKKAPDMAHAKGDHQNRHQVKSGKH